MPSTTCAIGSDSRPDIRAPRCSPIAAATTRIADSRSDSWITRGARLGRSYDSWSGANVTSPSGNLNTGQVGLAVATVVPTKPWASNSVAVTRSHTARTSTRSNASITCMVSRAAEVPALRQPIRRTSPMPSRRSNPSRAIVANARYSGRASRAA